MSELSRVFITGMGALTASGHTVTETYDSLLAGNQGFADIQQWDISSWSHRLGGEIKSFEPSKSLPDRKLMKVISKQDVLGINAAMQAVTHSQLLDYRNTLSAVDEFNEQTAVFVGSPGNKYYQQYDFLPLLAKSKGDMGVFAEQLFGDVHPMWLLRILPNNVLAYTGITFGFKGVNHNITNHAVSGTQAIIEAYHAIQQGQAERAVVVAYDVGTEPQSLFYYTKLGLVSGQDLKPFDSAQDGTILADGAAAIVLESEASARLRGATCYAEMVAGGARTEAAGLFASEADGSALSRLISTTLRQGSVDPAEVGVIVAHGNGNPRSDLSEANAIHAVFGEHTVPVTAFKWSVGHTLCASGTLDTVLLANSLAASCIPGIANLANQAPEYGSLNLSREPRSLIDDKPYAVLINRGFASMNACVVLKRYE
jgi:3-oxoacyl-[acyl-carrier-protein] synthase-1